MSRASEKNKLILSCIAAVIFSFVCAYLISSFGGNFIKNRFETRQNCEGDSYSEILAEEKTLSQSLDVPFTRLEKLSIDIVKMNTASPAPENAVIGLSLKKDGAILFEGVTAPLSGMDFDLDYITVLKPQATYDFAIPADILIGEGKYTLEITPRGFDEESDIALRSGEDRIYVGMKGELPARPLERYIISVIYVFAFALIAVRVFAFSGPFRKERFDTFIIWYTLFIFTFTFTYLEDTIMIYENARVAKSAIKHGQLLRYYDFALEQSRYRLNANYNVILYIIFAICMLPYDIAVKLFGSIPLCYAQLWFNMIVCALYVFMWTQFRRLLKLWGIEEKLTETVRLLYYVSPVLLFCTVGFCQLEIFYLIVFMEGLILFEKGKTDKACLVWSLSVAMKAFPLLLIIPLILLREKRLIHIMRYVAEVMVLTLIFELIYGGSQGWIYNQMHNAHYVRIFSDMIPSQSRSVSIFIVLYLLLVFYCWAYKGKESYKSVILCGLAVYMSYFCFTSWNPQYAAMTGVFMVLAALIAEDLHIYLGIEAFFALGYITSIWIRCGDVNNNLVLNGIVGVFRCVDDTPLKFREFVNGITDFKYPLELVMSITVAAGIFLTAYIYRSVKRNSGSSTHELPAGYIYLPMLPVFAILLLSGIISFSS